MDHFAFNKEIKNVLQLIENKSLGSVVNLNAKEVR